jgi:hypothetical protein
MISETCTFCSSVKIVKISAKCRDCCWFDIGDQENDGEPPNMTGLCGGSFVEFLLCYECHRVQGLKSEEYDLTLQALKQQKEKKFNEGSDAIIHCGILYCKYCKEELSDCMCC